MGSGSAASTSCPGWRAPDGKELSYTLEAGLPVAAGPFGSYREAMHRTCSSDPQPEPRETDMSMLGAGTMNGTSIKNPQGDGLGDIKDLMIDLKSGRVAYAVVEFGGRLGMGSKLFAVPLSALRQDAQNKCFVLNATEQSLENAARFDKDHWPDLADRNCQEARAQA